jgi:hypothetical protein
MSALAASPRSSSSIIVIAISSRPATVTPQGWRQTAIFICVIAGMVTDPLPARRWC